MSARTFLLVLALAPVVASAEIYKWTDAQGRTHYSSTPPAKTKADKVEVTPQPVTDSPNLHQLHTLASQPKPEGEDKDKKDTKDQKPGTQPAPQVTPLPR
jgi:hypothetical protein